MPIRSPGHLRLDAIGVERWQTFAGTIADPAEGALRSRGNGAHDVGGKDVGYETTENALALDHTRAGLAVRGER
ncbi:hypothetical protein [Sphaerisporangium siamense]|uniref:Uncharacterized protein n=1 Tax=Sphaerisporangium siamense TaxID=795645 RepID=A0A7W7D5Q7_9ACTN|nr:hypothetical protein [Sphaerisporangium siamense]MBB4699396.1 hypothetical protein [Sphaerisporangium siamense]